MVTILSLAFTAESGIEQERCTSPLMCTEQAPHCATPQPYLVPVSPTCSRITQSRGVSLSTSTSRTLPLMLSFAIRLLVRRLPRTQSLAHLARGCSRLAQQRPRRYARIDHRHHLVVAGAADAAVAALELGFPHELREIRNVGHEVGF